MRRLLDLVYWGVQIALSAVGLIALLAGLIASFYDWTITEVLQEHRGGLVGQASAGYGYGLSGTRIAAHLTPAATVLFLGSSLHWLRRRARAAP